MTFKMRYFKKTAAGKPDYSDEYKLQVEGQTAYECMLSINCIRYYHNTNWYTDIEIVDIQE